MGVDYLHCDDCGNSYPDCGHCGWCVCGNDYCGRCFDALKKKYGVFGDLDDDEEKNDPNYEEGSLRKCDYCSLVKVDDFVLVNFLLSQLNMTREEAMEKYRNAQS